MSSHLIGDAVTDIMAIAAGGERDPVMRFIHERLIHSPDDFKRMYDAVVDEPKRVIYGQYLKMAITDRGEVKIDDLPGIIIEAALRTAYARQVEEIDRPMRQPTH